MEKGKSENRDINFVWVTMITVVVIIGLWLLTYYNLKDLPETNRGTFGDMFGGINSLFSGLALAGIILTILLQRKELSLQRQELIETREELKRTADAQEKSEIALNRQAENLKISAKLSALSTLLNHYGEREIFIQKNNLTSPLLNTYRSKKEDCVRKIEEILERKEQ